MKTLTVPAAYGYQELRLVQKRYMMLAMLIAITIQMIVVGGYHLAQRLEPEDKIVTITCKFNRAIDIPLPPSIIRENLPISAISSYLKAENALPIPVPDAIADTMKTIESQPSLSQQTDPLAKLLVDGKIDVEVVDEPASDPLPTEIPLFEKEPIPVIIPKPEYPEIARRIGLEGNVTVKALINRDGNVKNVILLKSSDDIFSQAALEAAKKWVFTPALMNGKPVPVWVAIPFRFRFTK